MVLGRRTLLAALVLCLGGGAWAVAGDDFVVVVHPSVAGTSIRRSDLAAVFLKKAVRWGAGGNAAPVDQSGTAAVRRAFSEEVLGMSPTAVVQYWQKQMLATSPLRPPVVKASDDEVLAFVAATEGAVGYVSKAAALPPGVKAVTLID